MFRRMLSPLLPPSQPHPSGLFCVVSCIDLALAIYFTYGGIHVSVLFSQIIPPSPSPTESEMAKILLTTLPTAPFPDTEPLPTSASVPMVVSSSHNASSSLSTLAETPLHFFFLKNVSTSSSTLLEIGNSKALPPLLSLKGLEYSLWDSEKREGDECGFKAGSVASPSFRETGS